MIKKGEKNIQIVERKGDFVFALYAQHDGYAWEVDVASCHRHVFSRWNLLVSGKLPSCYIPPIDGTISFFVAAVEELGTVDCITYPGDARRSRIYKKILTRMGKEITEYSDVCIRWKN